MVRVPPTRSDVRAGRAGIFYWGGILYASRTMEQERSDEDLMLGYRDGVAADFEQVYQRHKGSLYRYMLRQAGQASIAEELFQDVWMRIIRAHRRYQPLARFKTYLYHLAHNVLIDHYRHRSEGLPQSYDKDAAELVDAQAGDKSQQPEELAASQQQLERLLGLIARLPEAQCEAFLLREEVGLSLDEIARVTDVKLETAKSRIRYALQRLRQGMRETA